MIWAFNIMFKYSLPYKKIMPQEIDIIISTYSAVK